MMDTEHENYPYQTEDGSWNVIYLCSRAEGVCEAEFEHFSDALAFAESLTNLHDIRAKKGGITS